MKPNLIISFMLAGAVYASGQSLAPVLLGSGTGSGTSGDAHIYWSAGESAVYTLAGSENLITQGFWQPELEIFTGTQTPSPADFGIQCTPNPVSDALLITCHPDVIMDIALFSLDGRLLLQVSSISNGYVLPMAYWPAAVYWLRFTTPEGALIMTQKIAKQ